MAAAVQVPVAGRTHNRGIIAKRKLAVISCGKGASQ